MKRSQVLATAVVVLFVLTSLPVHLAQAQTPYSEKLNVYVSGNDALWYLTYSGVNGSSALSSFEASPGMSWYNITAINAAGWYSDFQPFGPSGYNLIPVPFIPTQGLFLTIGSESYTDASASAADLNSYFMTVFASYSNDSSTGTYTFYSPLSFSSVIPSTLLKFLPTTEGGFANLIRVKAFLATSSPIVVYGGVSTGSGFEHTLVVGSIYPTALGSAGKPAIRNYFGSNPLYVQASDKSASSSVRLRVLDGIIQSSDASAQVSSDSAAFTASYGLALSPGSKVYQLNATIVQSPAPLFAARTVNKGVLFSGDSLEVTLSFKNLAPLYTITNLTFSDNWWGSRGDFSFLGGNYTVTNKSLAPGKAYTLVYRLEYTGTGTGSATIPATVVKYQYQAYGLKFNATTILNPIRLSLGADDAVVYATLYPILGFGKVVGGVQQFNLTVYNVGTLSASSVVAGGKSISGLAAKLAGALDWSQTVLVSQRAGSLTDINTTKAYSVTYENPSGNSFQTSTNSVTDYFSHVAMSVGFPVLKVSASLTPISSSRTNLTLVYSLSDVAAENVTDFVATGYVPKGLGCGNVTGSGLSCSGDVVSIYYAVLNSTHFPSPSMHYTLTAPANYILPPLAFHGFTTGFTISGGSNPVAIPAGLVLSKQFTPTQLFGGMDAQVAVSATNSGPAAFYNLTLSTEKDSFDTVSATTALSESSSTLLAGKDFSFSYGVTTAGSPGVLKPSGVSAQFDYGGTFFSITGSAPKVQMYRPLNITISTSPSAPEEGKGFVINFKISNPAPIEVTDVQFALPVPSGLGLSNLNGVGVSSGVLTIDVASLGPNGVATASADAVAGSGITIPFDKATLTFSYAGTTVNGSTPSRTGIAIAENVTTRYLIPTAFILLALLATAYYVRRKVATVPSSPK